MKKQPQRKVPQKLELLTSFMTSSITWSVAAVLISLASCWQNYQTNAASERENLVTRRDSAARESYDLNSRIQTVDYELSLLKPDDSSIPLKRIAISGLKKQFEKSESSYRESEEHLAALESRPSKPLGLDIMLFPPPAIIHDEALKVAFLKQLKNKESSSK